MVDDSAETTPDGTLVLGWWDDDPRFTAAPELPVVLNLADQAKVSLIGKEAFLI